MPSIAELTKNQDVNGLPIAPLKQVRRTFGKANHESKVLLMEMLPLTRCTPAGRIPGRLRGKADSPQTQAMKDLLKSMFSLGEAKRAEIKAKREAFQQMIIARRKARYQGVEA